MSVKVIGAGFGRTGTTSLKTALEMLGFSKCHHMIEVYKNDGQADSFIEATKGGRANWGKIFQSYQATCDWPSCYFWKELSDYYPEAKVVLSVRDPESWYRSMTETLIPITQAMLKDTTIPNRDMVLEIFYKRTFLENIEDKQHMLDVFEQHNQKVRDTVAPDRLLEFAAKDGWDPLCTFLGVAVPDEPYPRANAMDEVPFPAG